MPRENTSVVCDGVLHPPRKELYYSRLWKPTEKRKWRCSPAISGPLSTFPFCFTHVYLDTRPSRLLSARCQLGRPSLTLSPTLSMSINVYRRRCRRCHGAPMACSHQLHGTDVHGEHRLCIGSSQIIFLCNHLPNYYFLNIY